MKTSAVVKRDRARKPEVKVLTEAKGRLFPPGRMLIASPLAVAGEIAKIPAGRVLTLEVLRERLARRYRADYTCPLTTGIFLRIAAEAAVEEGSDLPWWRVVRGNGRLIGKLPGAEAEQARRLIDEGVACTRAGANGWRLASRAAES